MPGTEFKNQVDNLMNILFGAGVASHATIIEQINYLVFLRSLSKKDDNAMILDSSAEKIFSGELAKYHWDNLLVLNAEVLFTTLEEIFRKLPELASDQTIRLLFRDAHVKIFDKPTLRRLVHEIEKMMGELEKEASSGHTDIFGDMYEYLLSKQAQAGTLGQFRTPRHIIKFIVDIIDPNKGETILDPACGTAGFLVSALEHLKEKYTSGELKRGGRLVMDKLNKGERDFVYQHTFTGFDSDSDMFKFGLMNLYLHKLEHPNIKRQNTLVDTAGDRTKWDIILANPPFAGALDQESVSEDLRMNTRATEVLFLKYIVDHLSQNGRAGVIVPEGVLFNSNSAHKKIRQILVEDAGLWCVVSLPSGVFNPYAGVKTSILLFDKSIKDKNKEILFVKIENDGFELGAQRRPTNKDDLPRALVLINKFKDFISSNVKSKDPGLDFILKNHELTDLFVFQPNDFYPAGSYDLSNEKAWELRNKLSNFFLSIEAKKIVESGDYILSSDRYITKKDYLNAKWPMVEIGSVCTFEYGKPLKSEDRKGGQYPVFGSNGIVGYHNELLVDGPFIIVGRKGTAGAVTYSETSGYPIDTTFYVKLSKKNEILLKYLYYILKSAGLDNVGKQAGVPGLNRNDAYKIKIPLPSIEVQKQIVEELDRYQKIIDGAREVVENWKPKIDIDPKWDNARVEDITTLVRGSSPRPQGDKRYYGGPVPRLMVSDVTRDGMYTTPKTDFLTTEGAKLSRSMKKGEVVMAVSGNPGLPTILAVDSCIHDGFVGFRNMSSRLLREFLYFVLLHQKEFNKSQSVGAVFKNLTTDQIKQFLIPVPPLEIQRRIVEKIEFEQNLVEGNKKLIEVYQQRIKEKIENV